jgi:4,5-DOPA dioxygenase extradiol
MQPTLFLSHGSPMTALTNSPARDFLAGLGAALADRPKAILVISAHWETERPTLNAVPQNVTIHDFYGFPKALSRLLYEPPGAPDLAVQIAKTLRDAGFDAAIDTSRGLDHGAWIPLLLAYPEADIPVLQLSVQTHLGPEHHYRMGAALAELREAGVLILGSGSFTHDLRRFRGGQALDAPETPDITAFSDWMDRRLRENDVPVLLDYRDQAPFAAQEHPTEEHLLPLYVALGAAQPDGRVVKLHQSVEFGFLRMDSYAFQ